MFKLNKCHIVNLECSNKKLYFQCWNVQIKTDICPIFNAPIMKGRIQKKTFGRYQDIKISQSRNLEIPKCKNVQITNGSPLFSYSANLCTCSGVGEWFTIWKC